MKEYSFDNNFYYEVYEKGGLYRIKYFLNTADTTPTFVQVCGTNASIFDDINLAQKEAQRMLEKYNTNPSLFR